MGGKEGERGGREGAMKRKKNVRERHPYLQLVRSSRYDRKLVQNTEPGRDPLRAGRGYLLRVRLARRKCKLVAAKNSRMNVKEQCQEISAGSPTLNARFATIRNTSADRS